LDYNSARALCQSFSNQITGLPTDIISIDYPAEFTFINNLVALVNPGLDAFVSKNQMTINKNLKFN
jgi:hypothetical protein